LLLGAACPRRRTGGRATRQMHANIVVDQTSRDRRALTRGRTTSSAAASGSVPISSTPQDSTTSPRSSRLRAKAEDQKSSRRIIIWGGAWSRQQGPRSLHRQHAHYLRTAGSLSQLTRRRLLTRADEVVPLHRARQVAPVAPLPGPGPHPRRRRRPVEAKRDVGAEALGHREEAGPEAVRALPPEVVGDGLPPGGGDVVFGFFLCRGAEDKVLGGRLRRRKAGGVRETRRRGRDSPKEGKWPKGGEGSRYGIDCEDPDSRGSKPLLGGGAGRFLPDGR